MFFKKKDRHNKQSKEKKPKIFTINPRKKLVQILWGLLIISFSFAIHKHFTAIDTHTIEEKIIVEQQIRDTNAIENFVREFAKNYYSWEPKEEKIKKRNNNLQSFLTEDLQAINSVMISNNTPTSSSVQDIQIWNIEDESQNIFEVTFSVLQQITESDNKRTINGSYKLSIYVDEKKNLIIIKNPTLTTLPTSSSYQPTPVDADHSLNGDIRQEIDEFLATFFTLYPSASQSEISYYVENNVLPSINKEYTFLELINPVYTQEGDYIRAYVFVKFHDEQTKVDQLSQYEFLLRKDNTWKIIEAN